MIKLTHENLNVRVTWHHTLPVPDQASINTLVGKMDKRYLEPAEVIPGKTTCNVFIDDKLITTGEAKQHYKDNYSRPIGRKIAITRALLAKNDKSWLLTKELRRKIWESYQQICKK